MSLPLLSPVTCLLSANQPCGVRLPRLFTHSSPDSSPCGIRSLSILFTAVNYCFPCACVLPFSLGSAASLRPALRSSTRLPLCSSHPPDESPQPRELCPITKLQSITRSNNNHRYGCSTSSNVTAAASTIAQPTARRSSCCGRSRWLSELQL